LDLLGERKFGGFHNCSYSDCRPLAAAPALIAPVPTHIDKTMRLLSTSGTAESIWPAGLPECCLALFVCAVQLKELLTGWSRIRFICKASALVHVCYHGQEG
jgi:hypothetical protein